MKKEVKKYAVLESLTEEGIRSVGVSRWMRKYVWLWISALVFLAAIMLISSIDEKVYDIAQYPLTGIVVLFALWWIYKIMKVGKQFFNQVKDLPEPIDLRETK
jgi:hypothetical protein